MNCGDGRRAGSVSVPPPDLDRLRSPLRLLAVHVEVPVVRRAANHRHELVHERAHGPDGPRAAPGSERLLWEPRVRGARHERFFDVTDAPWLTALIVAVWDRIFTLAVLALTHPVTAWAAVVVVIALVVVVALERPPGTGTPS